MTQTPQFFDRFTRSWSDQPPPGAVLSSQFVLRGPIQLDREEFRGVVLLVDNDEGVTAVQTDRYRVNIPVIQGARRDTLRAARDVAARIRQWRDLELEWRELVSAVDPLILSKDISDLLNVDGIERALADNTPHLRSVFHTPFSELEFSAERMAAPRARRISRRATQVLAARSEDWLRAGASGITPRTVEALVRDEIIDTYENRVAARLIDDVRRHLKGVLAVYSELTPLMQLVRGPYRKAQRLSSLWGRQPPDDELREALLRRQSRVQGLLKLVDELRDSRLYGGVPVRARVSQPIRMTNLLQQDTNYRGVRRLWSEWWNARGNQGAVEDRRSQQLSEAESFFDLAWLTVSHAMLNLARPEPGASHSEDLPLITTPWGTVTLEKADDVDDGTWWFSCSSPDNSTPMYRGVVIAVACELLRGTVPDVRQRVELLNSYVRIPGSHDVFVLCPGTAQDISDMNSALDNSAAFGPLAASADARRRDLWLIPISPLDLESTERVERALRWGVIGSALLSYPPRVQLAAVAQQVIGARPFLNPVSGGVDVVEIPSERALQQLHHELDQHSRRLRQQLRGTGLADAQLVAEASIALDQACSRLRSLSTCPVCANVGQLAGRSAHTLEVTCRACSTRWGLRHDPSSNHRIPYLWIGEDLASLPKSHELSSWLGRDVLAEPCRHPAAEYSSDLINPWTGRCTGAGRLGSTCPRCLKAPPT